MNVAKLFLFAFALSVSAPSVVAQPAKAPPADFQTALWASSCMACHGPDGKAEGVGMSIGGRPAEELSGLMIEFKTGKRPATIMHQHAKGYSDDELKRIAQYFSQIK